MIFINKAVIMQCPHSMPFLTLPLGTEDFQQQKVSPFVSLHLLLLTFLQYYFYDLVLLFSSLGCVSKWLIHRLYIVGYKMGHSRANVIVLAISKKASLRFHLLQC